jgi:arabinofuranan 3-O-arabinosyltransferase
LAVADQRLLRRPFSRDTAVTGRGGRNPLAGWPVYALLAVIAYVPLLFTSPGQVGADTKQYLYLDPGRLIQGVASMWDPNVGMGTVTHQMIGYLLPMGPFYFVFHHLGVATWVAQRLWLGSLLFTAGTGMLYLLRVLGVAGPGRPVAALAYMLSPYLLEYAARISAILMPWAGLPWMLALAILALRRGGWRYPALFALVVALVGGVNATSLIYAGVAPVLWFPYAVWISREVSWRRALATFGRIGLLTVLVSLWWMAGLWVQGAFGLDVLRYTETVKTVARTSLSAEVLRGLGYWFFYGQDKLGPWIQPAVDYTQRLWLIGISYALPVLALVAAVFVRWRHRAYFALMIFVGTVLAVGAYPYNDPTPFGGVLKTVSNGSTVGLAMRSTGRAVPLVVLATATLLGVGVTALYRRVRRAGLVAGGVLGALVLANVYPLWAGTLIGGNLQRPEAVPSYWYSAANYVDSQSRDPAGGYDTRVLGIPGSDFASYRWGNTVDPIEPGLMQRPYVARELFPYGTAGTVDLLNALDSTLQQDTFVPSSLAPTAALMSAGDVLVRSDLQYERYNTPRPQPLWEQMTSPVPSGLSSPVGFGTPGPSIPVEFPMQDETALATPPGTPYPPPVSVFKVSDPRPIVRADPANRPLLVDGDGQGLVYAADTGLLDTNAAVIYSPSLATKPSSMKQVLSAGADLVLTDTNAKQARRWGTIRENTGYVETATETPPVYDPSDQRLPLFPGAGVDSYTVAQQRGVSYVTASAYGNPISYTPEDRPANAFDGNIRTNWTVGDFDNPVGQWLRIGLTAPVTTNYVTLVQPIYGTHNRYITTATLTFDGKDPTTVHLNGASRQASGQVVRFPTHTFSTLQITVDATDVGPRASYAGLSGVGFAEVKIGNSTQHVDEVLQLPEDMLKAAGSASIQHRLVIVMTRDRAPVVPPRRDPEPQMARTFWLPTARDFTLTGTARLSAVVGDNVIDQTLGQAGSDGSGVIATSSTRLTGDVKARASATIDNNPGTFWASAFGPQVNQWLQYQLPAPITFGTMNLQVIADGRHSVPTQVRIDAGGQSRVVDLPPITNSRQQNATTSVPLSFAPLTGSVIRVTFTGVRNQETKDYYSGQPITMPLGLAEVGIPGLGSAPTPPATLPGTCRSDLLTLDGRPLSVEVTGTTAAAQSLSALNLTTCGPDAAGIRLAAGNHILRTVAGHTTGIDLDQLSLASARGGAPLGPTPTASVPAATSGPAPAVRVVNQNRTVVSLQVHNPGHPFWLVLGESNDRGWKATLSNGRSLGQPQLIDGYANGWYVNPAGLPATISATIAFTPQNVVWGALILSALAILMCLGIAFWPLASRRRRARAATVAADAVSPVETDAATIDAPPTLHSPFASGGRRPSLALALTAAAGVGVIAAVFIEPLAGVLLAVVALWALLSSRARSLLTVGSVTLVAATGLYFVAEQYRYRYPAEFEWPTFFPIANTLVWIAIALLLADIVVELVRRGRPGGPSGRP